MVYLKINSLFIKMGVLESFFCYKLLNDLNKLNYFGYLILLIFFIDICICIYFVIINVCYMFKKIYDFGCLKDLFFIVG